MKAISKPKANFTSEYLVLSKLIHRQELHRQKLAYSMNRDILSLMFLHKTQKLHAQTWLILEVEVVTEVDRSA